jgi:hypothetical protein
VRLTSIWFVTRGRESAPSRSVQSWGAKFETPKGAHLALGHERLEDAGGLPGSMKGSGRWRRRRSIRSIRILESEASTEARMWRALVS